MTRWLLHPEVLEGDEDHPAWSPMIDDSRLFQESSALDSDLASGAYGRTVMLPEVADFELSYLGVIEGEQRSAVV